MSGSHDMKNLPVGEDDFATLIESNNYYIDKTAYLKSVFNDDASVLLFTRPRRFGKTITLSMFDCFFAMEADGRCDMQKKLRWFSGLEILRDQAFVDANMGRYPVVFITLKSVQGNDFTQACNALATLVAETANAFDFLQDSPRLTKAEREKFQRLCDEAYLSDPDHLAVLTFSLRTLCLYLFKHFERKVLLLIDEYDVPLAKAASKNYHDKMVTFISGFFDLLKTSPSGSTSKLGGGKILQKVVMTGCLKVAKNSIFTGVNNLSVNTVLSNDPNFSSIMGFTKPETQKILQDYDLAEYTGMVRDNYDGYRFYKDEIFCPWDVVKFVKINRDHKNRGELSEITAENYWNNSTSDPALKGYLGYLSQNDNLKMQELIDGHDIEISVNDSMNYDDLSKHRPDDFWSLLLHTGYLTSDAFLGNDIYRVRIPNLEVRECFRTNIQEYFKDFVSPVNGENKAVALAAALLEGDVARAQSLIADSLRVYVSLRDFANRSKPENFYQGLMVGILSTCSDKAIVDFQSNAEAGDGYADISFTDPHGNRAVILELKSCRSEDIAATVQDALRQIDERNYAEKYLKKQLLDEVMAYALVFSGKRCHLKLKRLT